MNTRPKKTWGMGNSDLKKKKKQYKLTNLDAN